MSCTASDFVNIQPLTLSDTFNTWFDRTNEVIAAANGINILDVVVGSTAGGLLRETGCSAGYYNGVVTLSVNPGAGIGIGDVAFGDNFNKVVVDAIRLENLGTGASANPAVGDYIIVSDISDTRQGAAGTPKRTTASRMLPPAVYFGETGSGTFEIYGDVTIHGNINIEGDQSYIDANDLRIEDKIIELAYNRYSQFTVQKTGMTSGSFNVGATAYYIDPGSATLTANSTTIGYIRAFTYSGSTTGSVQMHSFSEGGVSDIVNGGSLYVDGASLTFDVVSTPAIDTAFYNDTLLTPAGIDIKGASGDKTFLWNLKTPDTLSTWNAFVANTNLGVTGADNYIISSKFASFGYGAADDTYTFYGSGDSFTKAAVGTELVLQHSQTGAAGITFAQVFSGSTGPAVYPGVTATNWSKYLNADQLDGAHALTTATAWSIPISLANGRIHEDWINSDAIRKTFSQTGHSFVMGDILRFDTDGSLTFARADTVPTAEAIGMVEVASGSTLTLVTKGFISGLTGARINALKPLATGNAYYLSASVGGGMIANPDSGAYEIMAGQVRKAMFIATGIDKGYVVNYTGVVIGNDPTDLIYLNRVAPVGSIHPFAGLTSGIPDGWLLCDGAAVSQNQESDLFAVIENTYYAEAEVYDSTTFVLDGDTRGIAVGDALRVVWATGNANVVITSFNSNNRRVTVSSSAFSALAEGTDLKVYGRTVPSTTGRSIFFLPDLRRRTIFGASFGSGLAGSGVIVPSLAQGALGGESEVTLATSNIPPHTHSLDSTVTTNPFSTSYGSTTTQTGGILDTGNSPSPFPILPPHAVMHYIIRAKKGENATVLTGHDHDNRYIRYDINHTVGAGASRTLTDADRVQFRSNAKVLRNDGDDVFGGTLTITGDLFVLGAGGTASGVDVTVSGGMNSDFVNTNHAFINGSALIKLSSAQAVNITGPSNTFVRMFPALNYGLTGANRYYDQTQNDSDSRNLVVDYKTGEVTCRAMFNVGASGPPASTAGYPEGFVWYTTGTGNNSSSGGGGGGSFADSITYLNDSSTPFRTWSWTYTNFGTNGDYPNVSTRGFQILQDVPLTAKFAYITVDSTVMGDDTVLDLRMWVGRTTALNRGHLIFSLIDYNSIGGSNSSVKRNYTSPAVLVPLVQNGSNIGYWFNFEEVAQTVGLNSDVSVNIRLRLDGYF